MMNTSRESFRVSTEPGQSQSQKRPDVDLVAKGEEAECCTANRGGEGSSARITLDHATNTLCCEIVGVGFTLDEDEPASTAVVCIHG